MSFLSKLKDATKSVSGGLLDLNNPEEKNTVENRRAICEECPHLRKPLNQCAECGCFVGLKSKLRKAQCPIGKW